MPTLETTDGETVAVDPAEVNAQFQAAMNDDGPDTQAPPKRTRRAAAAEEPEAPKPRRGRPPKEEKARTADKATASVKDDYTDDARNLVGAVWTVAASVGVTQPYALVVESNADGLVAGLAEGAKHNATIRAFVSSGESSWMLGLASVGLTMGMQVLQIARDPELRKQAAETTREHLRAAMGAKGLHAEPDYVSPAA